MRTPLPIGSVLSLLFLASVAMARAPDARLEVRTLLLSDHPTRATHSIYVSGQVTTVLRFEQDCDPARTKLLGWEGRFEPPLVGGRKVVLEPIRDLGKDERIPLLVTLVDGTEIPFLVSPPLNEEWGWTDQQVNVFKDSKSYDAVLSTLYATLKREERLKEENERLKKEEKSVDHAWATLLVHGEQAKTPFRKERKMVLKNEDMDITIEAYSGPGKTAAVIHLTNTYNERPWKFRDARLTSTRTSDTARPFALRMDRTLLVQGQSGTIAVVADKSAFESKAGLVDLFLEIYREDGLQQVTVMLDHTLIRK
ncbi:DUF2381 family protein [Archangium lipolyticum]|uniref:DUF2381 family protein n=1 Tax=Archangium lipolyticum TaxID=2970465 RepID=UPI00214A82BB|nr:DUF2381 family protein [Archangium lipolyticum]